MRSRVEPGEKYKLNNRRYIRELSEQKNHFMFEADWHEKPICSSILRACNPKINLERQNKLVHFHLVFRGFNEEFPIQIKSNFENWKNIKFFN